MQRFLLLILIASLSIQGLSAQTELDSDSIGIWTIGEKIIPVPFDASIELQDILANTAAPNIHSAKQRRITGVENWNQFIEGANPWWEKYNEQLKKDFSVTVTADIINGVVVRYIVPNQLDPRLEQKLFIHLHAGGYVLLEGNAGIGEAIILASRSKIKVVSIDYSMPPANPFPASINDVEKVYRILLEDYSSKNIAIGGTSSGGGLALATIHKLKELNLDVPGAAFVGSGWVDLTKTGDTHYTNEGIDRITVTYDTWIKDAAYLYAGKEDLTNPYISPVYGDFDNFPPTYLVSGTRDLFLSDMARVHRKMKKEGVIADLNVYEGMSHAEYFMNPYLPESIQVYEELGKFLIQYLQPDFSIEH